MNNIYRGVLIEQSVSNVEAILADAKVVGSRSTSLESESERGEMRFLNLEVKKDKLWDVLRHVAETIEHPNWYFHLVGEGRMYVVLSSVIFFADEGDEGALESIRNYAISQGIHRDQLSLKGLFTNPYA